jgi:UrcA family protein
MKTTLATGLLAGLAACALAPSAIAAETGLTEPTAIAVPVSDLDLSLPADLARLDRRITAAASRACPMERGRARLAAACRAEARSLALDRANHAMAAARRPGTAQLAGR